MKIGTAAVEIDGDIRPLERALAIAQARVERFIVEMQDSLDSLDADVGATVARLVETANPRVAMSIPLVAHASEIDDRGLEDAEALLHELRHQHLRYQYDRRSCADPRVDRALAALDAVRKLTKPTV